MPQGIKPGRPPVWTRRQLIDGIRWRTRTGAPWRDVPERYGPWDRAYDLFLRWQRDGTWARLVTQLQAEADAKGLISWDVNVDSTEPFPTSDGEDGRGGWAECRWPSQPALTRMTAVSEPSGIHVAGYDPSWPLQAATAIDALRAAVPGLFAEIEHIGSTAVPGLAANPVIALMAAVHDLTHAVPRQAALADLGFHPHGNGMTDRWGCRPRATCPPGASCACPPIGYRSVQLDPAVPVRPAGRATARARDLVASASSGPAGPARTDPSAVRTPTPSSPPVSASGPPRRSGTRPKPSRSLRPARRIWPLLYGRRPARRS